MVEVLRGRFEGQEFQVVARRAGVDRKTARSYLEADQSAGLSREASVDAVDDEFGWGRLQPSVAWCPCGWVTPAQLQ